MSDKRILILVAANSAEDNGITIRGTAVRDALKNDYPVLMPSARSWYSASAPVLLAGYLAWMVKLLYSIPRWRVDCVYCCADYFGFVSSYLLSKVFGFRTVFEAHGILSEENKAKQRPTALIKACSYLERFVVAHADYVVALSRDILEFYSKFTAKIELIPAFIDESAYERGQNKTSDTKTVGLIGPFDMPANTYSLQFLRKHAEEFDPRIRFKVIGKCDDMRSSDRITFTGYINSRDAYVAELSSLDALFVPSKLPTSGPLNKVLEGMASSLPVFTSPEGAVGLDYLENDVNIVVRDRGTLVATINCMLFNEAFIGTIGHNARNLVERVYSKQTNEIKLQRVIGSITTENG